MINKLLRKLKNILSYFLSFFDYYLLKYKYSSILKGKDCFLVGSAPNIDLSLYNEKMKIISVNGSAENIYKYNLSPITLTIVDNELLDPSINVIKESRKKIISNELLKNYNLGTLFSTQSNLSNGGDPSVLKANFINYQMINKFICKSICKRLTNNNLINNDLYSIPSTGFIAIAICFYLGAKSVTLTGFSFYNNIDKIDTRSHTLADCALLTSLILNGFKIQSNDVDVLPLLSNWGRNPLYPYYRTNFRNN
jgi:hypothetical protein